MSTSIISLLKCRTKWREMTEQIRTGPFFCSLVFQRKTASGSLNFLFSRLCSFPSSIHAWIIITTTTTIIDRYLHVCITLLLYACILCAYNFPFLSYFLYKLLCMSWAELSTLQHCVKCEQKWCVVWWWWTCVFFFTSI